MRHLLHFTCVLFFAIMVTGLTLAGDSVSSSYPYILRSGQIAAMDGAGNLYVAQIISSGNAVDLNSGLGFNTVQGIGDNDVAITRINANGTYAWSQVIGGSDYEYVRGLSVDGSTVFVLGDFRSPNLGIGAPGTLNSNSRTIAYVAALQIADGSPVATFGSGGVQSISASARAILATNGLVYAACQSEYSNPIGIGSGGTVSALGTACGAVVALDGTTGLGVAGFGTNGVQRIGGSSSTYLDHIAVAGTQLYASGNFRGNSLGIGNLGTLNSGGSQIYDMFVASMNAANGAATSAFGTAGVQKVGAATNFDGTVLAASSGAVYVAGVSNGQTVSIGGSVAGTFTGGEKIYLAGLNESNGAGVAGFGVNGIATLGQNGGLSVGRMQASTTSLYLSGEFSNLNFGGTHKSYGGSDAFIAAFNRTSGSLQTGFGSSGIVQIGGGSSDSSGMLLIHGSQIYVTGASQSEVLSLGSLNFSCSSPFNSYVIPLDVGSGAFAGEAITSPLRLTVAAGQPLNYTVTGTGVVSNVLLTPVPEGLALAGTALTGIPGSSSETSYLLQATVDGKPIVAQFLLNIVTDTVSPQYPPVIQGGDESFYTQSHEAKLRIAMSASGELYVAGLFSDSEDFNPHQGLDLKISRGENDIYLTKFLANGDYAWTRALGSRGAEGLADLLISSDAVYVVGRIGGTDFSIDGAGSIVTPGTANGFVAAVSPATGAALAGFGNQGVVVLGGSGFDMCTAADLGGGSLYITGSFSSQNFGIGAPGSVNTGVEPEASFVVALNALNGAAVAGFGSGGIVKVETRYQKTRDILFTPGALYLTGSCWNTLAINGVSIPLGTVSNTAAFVVALNPATGTPVGTFGSSGARIIDGSEFEDGTNLFAIGSTLFVAGDSSSSSAAIAGQPAQSTNGSFIAGLTLDGNALTTFGKSGLLGFSNTRFEPHSLFSHKGKLFFATSSDSYQSQVVVSLPVGFQTVAKRGSYQDGYIFAINPSTGYLDNAFGSSGVAQVSANQVELTQAASIGGELLVAGHFFGSSDNSPLQIGDAGYVSYSNYGMRGFVARLTDAGSPKFPVLYAPVEVRGWVGEPLTIPIQSNVQIDLLNAAPLPKGLSVQGSSIVGTPQSDGNWTVQLSAATPFGTIRENFSLRIGKDSIGAPFLPQMRLTDSYYPNTQKVAADPAGNLYFIQRIYNASVDFNPEPGVDIFSVNETTIVVTRINADGTYGWSQRIEGTAETNAVAASGTTVYVVGRAEGTALGVGTSTPRTFRSRDVFVAALNSSNGTALASFGSGGIQLIGSTSDDVGQAVQIFNGTLYVGGSFQGNGMGIGAPGTLNILSSSDAFVAALDPQSGAGIAGFGTGGIQIISSTGSSDDCLHLAMSGTTLYAQGLFSGNNLGIGAAGTLSCAGSRDVFVAALHAGTGARVTGFGTNGVQSFGGSGDEMATGLVVDSGSLFVSGEYYSSNLGIGGSGSIANTGGLDAFIASIDSATGSARAGFGTGGIQTLGGTSNQDLHGITAANGNIYVMGTFIDTNLGIGGAGTFQTSGQYDVFVAAIGAVNGQPRTSFGSNGLQKIGGSSSDLGNWMVQANGKLWISLACNLSSNIGIGGLGTYVSDYDLRGLLIPLDPNSGANLLIPPLSVTSPLTSVATAGTPFTYSITATAPLAEASALGLPDGLVLTGTVISGTATKIGTFSIPLNVRAVNGTEASATLTLKVLGDQVAATFPPMIAAEYAYGSNKALNLAIDPSGNRYVMGQFANARDFNPGIGADIRLPAGSTDVFVTRFNADGTYAWTQTLGATGSDYASGIATDGTSIWVVGTFQGTNFGFNGVGTVSSPSLTSGFIARLNAATGQPEGSFGTNALVIARGGVNSASLSEVLHGAGGLFVSGQFYSSSLTFNGTGARTAVGGDGFVARLNPLTGVLDSGFGQNGTCLLTGSNYETLDAMVLNGSILYCAGITASSNAGIDAPGSYRALSVDAAVMAINATSGAPVATFGNGGLQSISGSRYEYAQCLAVSGGRLYVGGRSESLDVGIGKSGSLVVADPNDEYDSGGFLACLNATTGLAETGFGQSGLVAMGYAGSDYVPAVAVANGSVFAVHNANAQIAINGSTITDSFTVLRDYNAVTGAPGLHFPGGSEIFSGSGEESGFDLAVHGSKLWFAGTSSSADFKLVWNAQNSFQGFLLPYDLSQPLVKLPTLASPLEVTTYVGSPFIYTPALNDGLTLSSVLFATPPPGISAQAFSLTGIATQLGDFNVPMTLTISVSGQVVVANLVVHVIGDAVSNKALPIVRGGGATVKVAADAGGNLFVAGTFSGVCDFNPYTGSDFKQATGADDIFVTRFNADRSYAWTYVYSSPGDDGLGSVSVVDGVVYVAGDVTDMSNPINTPSGPRYLKRNGVAFAVSAATGSAQPGFQPIQIVGSGDKEVRAVAVHQGVIYIAGSFDGSTLGAGQLGTGASAGKFDGFVAAFDVATGSLKQSFGTNGFVIFGGSRTDRITALAADASGVYAAGDFSSLNAGFGGVGTISSLPIAGSSNGFVFKMDLASGARIAGFAQNGLLRFNSFFTTEVNAVLLNGGTLYVGGAFNDGYSSVGGLGEVQSMGFQDGFVIALNSQSGGKQSAFGSGGLLRIGGGEADRVLALALNDGTLVAGGEFSSSNFGIQQPGLLTAELTTGSTTRSRDGFVVFVDAATGASSIQPASTVAAGLSESVQSLAVSQGRVQAAGYASVSGVKFSGLGTFDAQSWNAFVYEIGNSAPVITQGAALVLTMDEDASALSIALDATDADGHALTWSAAPPANGGTVALNPIGNQASLLFTPATNFNGQVVFSATVVDALGASDSIQITINITPKNDPPQILSAPTAVPNPARIGDTVLFNLALHDPDADALTCQWSFGDSIQAAGLSASHSYLAAGTYTVSVVVSDGTHTALAQMVVVVQETGFGPLDADGDGFNDDVELYMGSNPNDSTSTPFGAAPNAPGVLALGSLSIQLQFETGRDRIRAKFAAPLPQEFLPLGQRFMVNIGGVISNFELDKRGGARLPGIKAKLGKRSTKNGLALMNITLDGNYSAQLADDGLTASRVQTNVTVPVELLFSAAYLRAEKVQKYSSNGRKGNLR